MKQFKGAGGTDQFKEVFQNMTKGMGLGKNARMDTNAFQQMQKQMETRERIRKNVEKKRAEMDAANKIKTVNGTSVFQLEGEKQEKSTKEDIDKIMMDLNLTNEIIAPESSQNNKKKKAKK
jgi:hypothetical protein